MRVDPFPGSPLRVGSPETACTRGERFQAQWGYLYSSGGEAGLPTHPNFPASTRAPSGVPLRTPDLHEFGQDYGAISARTVSRSKSTIDGTEMALMARSGSFSPCPVRRAPAHPLTCTIRAR